MKISNFKFVKKIAYAFISFIVVLFIGELYINISKYYLLINIILASQIFIFYKLKSTTIELSGGCLTIRKNHPLTFRKFISPDFELPYSRLLGFKIISKFGLRKLKIKVNSKRQNKFFMSISLFGFNNMQNSKLTKSLSSVIDPSGQDHKNVDPTLKTIA